MGNFVAELKRRHMYRVAAAYAVVAWVLLQLANNLAPGLGLPSWVLTLVIVLLAIGFPIVLGFAWILQLAHSDTESGRTVTGRLDWFLAGALVIVIALISYQQLAMRPPPPAAPSSAAIAIAVLPFANMSGDANQKYFSDGITEEISSVLAKLQGLTVLARSSSFAPQIANLTAREKAQALSARYLIEGSVRQAGNRVRISAQLVGGDDGVQVWTENYDRELTDIFAIQEDIAQAIATALRARLKPGDTLVSNRSIDPESYQKFLRAKALVRARGTGGLKVLNDGAALLEDVVARDPKYAPAWSLLSEAYGSIPQYDPAYFNGTVADFRRVVQTALPKAEAAAQRAIKEDANHAQGYFSLGIARGFGGKLVEAEDLLKKALALDPNNPDTLHRYSNLLAGLGRLRDAFAIRQQLQELEPFVPVFNRDTAIIMWANGQTEAAIEMLKDTPPNEARRATTLTMIYATMGRYDEAIASLRDIPQGNYSSKTVETAASLLRTAPAKVASPQDLPRMADLGFIYFFVGAPNRVLETFEDNVDAGYTPLIATTPFWHPAFAALRKTEQFKRLARKAGMLDYWRARGWPDLCHPATGDDFECS